MTWVPDRLPRLDVAHALAVVALPLHLNWSAPGRVFDLWSRADRARVYEIVDLAVASQVKPTTVGTATGTTLPLSRASPAGNQPVWGVSTSDVSM